MSTTLRLFERDPVPTGQWERLTEAGAFDGVPQYVLDVPESIPQLGYGSHQFFRYYGKFPSVVGREIIARHSKPTDSVLDVYAGSGTTLVEAQIAGRPSFGIDINPLAVLATLVKTRYYEEAALYSARAVLLRSVLKRSSAAVPSGASNTKLDKWFDTETQGELARLRACLLEMPLDPIREFFTLAFLGVVRRVSRAYDGEVRPHINPLKKPRSPIEAFARKTDEMIVDLRDLDERRPPGVSTAAVVGDNRADDAYEALVGAGDVGLVVAHPPYLNSFNYLQVFSLEFYWSEGFDEVWRGWTDSAIRKCEARAWPATDESVLTAYYSNLETTLRRCLAVMRPDGRIAIVIGDATIRGNLESVHVRVWEMLKQLGLSPVEIWYRTTHYGIGKYAYRHRADYHGDAEKRDAVIVFERRLRES
jgi:hypothetical protein